MNKVIHSAKVPRDYHSHTHYSPLVKALNYSGEFIDTRKSQSWLLRERTFTKLIVDFTMLRTSIPSGYIFDFNVIRASAL